ncbi:MAG: zinc ribbon domain-containing protein [Thermoplasmata archaeon]
MATSVLETQWGSCTFCGDAVPPDAKICPTCGKEYGTPAQRAVEARSRPVHRRAVMLRWLRILVVVGIVGAIGYAIIAAEIAGPTTYADSLTGAWTLTVPPGGWGLLAGNITGEDYITGNFSVETPVAANVVVAIYNSTEFAAFYSHQSAQAAVTPYTNVSSARIVFAAPYTDEYYFVFENPYPLGSNLTEKIYVATTYETNVVLG